MTKIWMEGISCYRRRRCLLRIRLSSLQLAQLKQSLATTLIWILLRRSRKHLELQPTKESEAIAIRVQRSKRQREAAKRKTRICNLRRSSATKSIWANWTPPPRRLRLLTDSSALPNTRPRINSIRRYTEWLGLRWWKSRWQRQIRTPRGIRLELLNAIQREHLIWIRTLTPSNSFKIQPQRLRTLNKCKHLDLNLVFKGSWKLAYKSIRCDPPDRTARAFKSNHRCSRAAACTARMFQTSSMQQMLLPGAIWVLFRLSNKSSNSSSNKAINRKLPRLRIATTIPYNLPSKSLRGQIKDLRRNRHKETQTLAILNRATASSKELICLRHRVRTM